MTDYVLLTLCICACIPALFLMMPQERRLTTFRGSSSNNSFACDDPVAASQASCGITASIVAKYIPNVKTSSIGLILGTQSDKEKWTSLFQNKVRFRFLNEGGKSDAADIVIDCSAGDGSQIEPNFISETVLKPGGFYFIPGNIGTKLSEYMQDVFLGVEYTYWASEGWDTTPFGASATEFGSVRYTSRIAVVQWTRTIEWGFGEVLLHKRLHRLDPHNRD